MVPTPQILTRASGLTLTDTTQVKLQTLLYDYTSPGGPSYPPRSVRHAATESLDALFPVPLSPPPPHPFSHTLSALIRLSNTFADRETATTLHPSLLSLTSPLLCNTLYLSLDVSTLVCLLALLCLPSLLLLPHPSFFTLLLCPFFFALRPLHTPFTRFYAHLPHPFTHPFARPFTPPSSPLSLFAFALLHVLFFFLI
jgi:hypothetical protein